MAGVAGLGQRIAERIAGALARHFQKAQAGKAVNDGFHPVIRRGLLHGGAHARAVHVAVHVDKINEQDAAEVAKPDLPGRLGGGAQVFLHGQRFPVRGGDGAAGVDINGGERLALVDDQRTAAGQRHAAAKRFVHLLFHPRGGPGCFHFHSRERLPRYPLGQRFGRLKAGEHLDGMARGIVPQKHAEHRGLLVQQGGGLAVPRALLGFTPHLPQGLGLGLHLGYGRKQRGVAHDQAETPVCDTPAQRLRAGAVLLAGHATAEAYKAVPGHEQHILSRQADIPRQESALLALGVFFDLYQHVLPGHERGAARGAVVAFRLAQGQKAVLAKAQLDKRGLHIGQNALHPSQKHRSHQAFRSRILLIKLQKARPVQKGDACGVRRALHQQAQRMAHAQTSSMGTSVPSGLRARMAVR